MQNRLNSQQVTVKTRPSPKFLAGTTFGCLFTLFAFNSIVNATLPEGLPDYRDMTNALISKLPGMLKAKDAPDVLLLGASGIVIPSVRCDDQFHQRPSRYDEQFMKSDIWKYAKSDYLADLLSHQLHKDVTIDNTGSGGCIMSDQYIVLKKYLDAGKRPEFVLITTGPKDFYDNLKPSIDKTPIYTELADLPIRLTDIVQGNCKIDSSVPEMSESLLRALSKFYFFREDYRGFLARKTSELTGHPESLEKTPENLAAQKATAGKDSAALASAKKAEPIRYIPNTNQDIKRFRKIYLPINKTQFDQQMAYLQKTIELAKSNGIAVQICFMPLAEEHKNILKPDAWDTYKKRVTEMAAKEDVACLDPQEEIGFEPDDFEDSAHLNKVGGKKFFNYLTEKICSDQKVAASIAQNGVLIGQH
ncbi:MAG: DUF1574 domain-containing protein [Candidatus Melainabacteria bacterium]|nr:MAG: DUF1574 domain-containing protein [Candidatus Melainabacteria bacterium]